MVQLVDVLLRRTLFQVQSGDMSGLGWGGVITTDPSLESWGFFPLDPRNPAASAAPFCFHHFQRS